MRYLFSSLYILLSMIGFSQGDTLVQKVIVSPFPIIKDKPIDNNKYLKVCNYIYYRTDYPNYEINNSIYLQEKSKLYYCILDDSLNLISKYEIKPNVFVLRYNFNFGDSVILRAESKQLVGPDSCLPKLINVYSLSFYKNGKYIEFYKNGNIKVKGKYKINSKHGKWKYYSEQGKVIDRKKFIKGKEKGVEAPLPLEE